MSIAYISGNRKEVIRMKEQIRKVYQQWEDGLISEKDLLTELAMIIVVGR